MDNRKVVFKDFCGRLTGGRGLFGRRVRRSESKGGFTLVELLVVIEVIALLMAILLPALTKAREQGKRAVCLTQIKQLQTAWMMNAIWGQILVGATRPD